MEYLVHLAILVGIYAILAQGFNLSFGMGRLFNLAHVATYAIGAYGTALLSTEHGWSFFPCLIFSTLSAGLFALIIGAISLRLSGDYFAIGTLAFSSVVTALLINWKSLTRGVLGIPGIPRPEFLGIDFYNNLNFLYLTYLLAAFAIGLYFILFRSGFARALKAQSEFEPASQAIGIDTKLNRNLSFFFASCGAGLAGSLYAYYLNYIDPSSFSLTEMVFVLTIIVLAKPGSFWGCLGATVFLVLLPEPLRFIEISPGILGPMRQLIYALILFAALYINRSRIFPLQREV